MAKIVTLKDKDDETLYPQVVVDAFTGQIDDVPTGGSDNFVRSNGVASSLVSLQSNVSESITCAASLSGITYASKSIFIPKGMSVTVGIQNPKTTKVYVALLDKDNQELEGSTNHEISEFPLTLVPTDDACKVRVGVYSTSFVVEEGDFTVSIAFSGALDKVTDRVTALEQNVSSLNSSVSFDEAQFESYSGIKKVLSCDTVEGTIVEGNINVSILSGERVTFRWINPTITRYSVRVFYADGSDEVVLSNGDATEDHDFTTQKNVIKVRFSTWSASYVTETGTCIFCILNNKDSIMGIYQSGVQDSIDDINQTLSEIQAQPWTINGISPDKPIYNYSEKVRSQYDAIGGNVYPFNERIINPDNLRTRESSGISGIDGGLYNVKCNYYKRFPWNTLQNNDGSYNFTEVDNTIKSCVENHTRLCTRVFYYNDAAFDSGRLLMPADYLDYKSTYDTYISANNITFTDNVAHIGGKPIILGYPSFVYWAMVKEGTEPYLKELSNGYTGVPNYESETYYDNWHAGIVAFASFLEDTIEVSYLSSPIKRKKCIEVLQGGSVGEFGEGAVNQDNNVYPENKNKLLRYFTDYFTIFPDVRISLPLAMYYDRDYYGYPTIESTLNSQNATGKCALFTDVIAYGTSMYTRPNYNPISNSFRNNLNAATRQIEGETSGTAIGADAAKLLTDIYTLQLSGATLDNYIPVTPLGYAQKEKAETLMGAKLVLVSGTTWRSMHSRYVPSTNKGYINLQNIGVSKVFSEYWKAVWVYRDSNGTLLGREDAAVNVQEIAPNSNTYENVGVLTFGTPLVEQTLTVPSGTKTISFAIIDSFGIYPNYCLYTKGRTAEGEYVIHTFS